MDPLPISGFHNPVETEDEQEAARHMPPGVCADPPTTSIGRASRTASCGSRPGSRYLRGRDLAAHILCALRRPLPWIPPSRSPSCCRARAPALPLTMTVGPLMNMAGSARDAVDPDDSVPAETVADEPLPRTLSTTISSTPSSIAFLICWFGGVVHPLRVDRDLFCHCAHAPTDLT